MWERRAGEEILEEEEENNIEEVSKGWKERVDLSIGTRMEVG